MAWFRRNKPKIEGQTDDEERKVLTEGIFVKCPECENALYKRELIESLQVCTHCAYHFRLGARERLDTLFDEGLYEKLDEEVKRIRQTVDFWQNANPYEQEGIRARLRDQILAGIAGGTDGTMSTRAYGS